MKKNGKSMIMQIIIIALAISIVVVVVLYANTKKEYVLQIEAHSDTYTALKETVEVLQRDDIQRLISYAKKVMAGEIIIEKEENPLSRYSYNSQKKDHFTTMETIEMSLVILEAHVDGDRGELIVSYTLDYLDSNGELIRRDTSSPESPSLWIIEKQGEDWIVIDIKEYPL